MISDQAADVARRAKQLYEAKLRAKLESTNLHGFVAIEPDSGEYFFGRTLSDSIQASGTAYPDRLAFALRVGHDAAVHIGVMTP